MLDIVGRLNAELCEIWSSFGGPPESVILRDLELHRMLRGRREEYKYFDG